MNLEGHSGKQNKHTNTVWSYLYAESKNKVKLTESGNRMWLPGAEEAKEMERSWLKATKLQLQNSEAAVTAW